MKKEINVKVIFTEGYEKRYTQACLEVLRKRDKKKTEASFHGLATSASN